MMDTHNNRVKAWLLNQYDRILLFLLPLVITLINPNWIYNPQVLNGVDTWVYTGLFRDFFDLASQFPSNSHYFAERLTAILPGYLLYQLFPTEIANAILHLSVYWITIFALYAVASRLFNRNAAFLSMLCLGSYTWFLRATGHDYVDGISIAYFSLSLWFVTEAIYRPAVYKRNLFLAGVSLCAMVVAQPFLAVFTIVVGLYYLVMTLKHHRNNLILSFVLTVLGGVLLLVILVSLNSIWFHRPNIFANTLHFIRLTPSIVTLRSSIYEGYSSQPLTWMVLPVISALCAIGWLLRSKILMNPQLFTLRIVVALFAFVYGIFIFMHYTTSFAYLIIYLYMSFLIPSTFLLLGIGLSYFSSRLTVRSSLYYTGLVLLPFVLITVIPPLESVLSNNLYVWAIIGVMSVIFIANLSMSYRRVYVLVAFSIINLVSVVHTGVGYYDRLNNYRVFMTAHATRDQVDDYLTDYPEIKQFVVFERAPNFRRYTLPLRGMSQPIHSQSFEFPSDNAEAQDFLGRSRGYQVVLLLSEDETDIEKLSDVVGDTREVETLFSFPVTVEDLSGAYSAHLLRIVPIDHYESAIFPNVGENIQHPSVINPPPRAVTWTGPREDVVLRFNLASARTNLIVQFCALVSTVDLDEEISAQVNQTSVTFRRSDGDEDCPIRYIATVPKEAIPTGGNTEVRLSIPTGWRNDELIDWVAGYYGIALTTVFFFERP